MNILRHPLVSKIGNIVGAVLLVLLVTSLIDVYRKRGVIKDYEQAYDKAKAENERLKAAMDEAETPEYVEKIARNKLGMAREGETVVLIDESQRPANPEQKNQKKPAEVPAWKQWWKLFF